MKAFHQFERTPPLLLKSTAAYSERFRDTFMAAVALVDSGAGTTTFAGAKQTMNLVACGWIDSTHVYSGGDTQQQALVGDITTYRTSLLLDLDQRLPVHLHPNRAFASAHLGLVHGKTEAWYVLDAPEGAEVGVGFVEIGRAHV